MSPERHTDRRIKLRKLTKTQLVQMLMEMSVALEESPAHVVPKPRTGRARGCAQCRDLQIHHDLILAENAEMEASVATYADLFDVAPVGYCRLDVAGVVTHANAAAQRMSAADRPLVGQRLSAFMPAGDRVAFQRELRCSLMEGCVSVVECSSFGLSGKSLRIDLILNRELWPSGGTSGFKVAIIDATKRRVAEHDLRMLSKASQTLGASLDHQQTLPPVLSAATTHFASRCFVDLLGTDGVFARFCADTGLSDDQREHIEAAYPRHADAAPQMQVIRSGKPLLSANFAVDASFSHTVPSGHACGVVPLIAHQKVVGCLTLLPDEHSPPFSASKVQAAFALAERIAMAVYSGQMHRDAQQAVRERQVVLGTVAHDLKNVITTIALRCETLTDMQDPDTVRVGRAILRSVERMDRMLEDLMDVASIDRGELSLRPVEHDAQRLLEEAVQSCRGLAESRGIALEVHTGAEQAIFCDADRCLQVLANLLGNAVKFSPPGSKITVGQRSEGPGHVRFSIADQGPGISKEALSHVFDNFWRAHPLRTDGRGLGLTICRGIVEGSGGRIWAESSLGEGSTFYFTMPIAQTLKRPCLPDGESRILVVEDDADLRLTTCQLLEKAGYQVSEASNGREALDMIEKQCRPCLVLLDLNMPVLSGWQFLEERSRSEALQALEIMVLSGEKPGDRESFYPKTIFVRKPISKDVLLSKIAERMQAPLTVH